MKKFTTKSKSQQNKKVIAFSIMIAFLILFIVAIILVKNNFFSNSSNPSNLSWSVDSLSWDMTQNYYIWNSIIQTWIVEPTEEFWLWFTHYLVQNWENVFWLKSSDVDLMEFTWDVEIKWTIVEKKKDLWIIDVLDIQQVIAENLTWSSSSTWTVEEKVVIENYNFWKYWLKIDLWNNSNYTASIVDWIINIKNKSNPMDDEILTWTSMSWDVSLIMSISPFICEKWSATKDCEVLNQKFSKLKFEHFKSVEWLNYYKIWEWTQWFFTNNNLWWYYVNTKTDKQLMNISSDIHPISAYDIKIKLTKYIWNICYDSQTKMKTIDWIKLEFQDKELIWIMTWVDESLNTINCKVKLWLWDTISTTLVDFNVSWKMNSSSSQDSAVVWVASSSVPAWLTWNMLSYSPKSWSFVIYLPKKLTFKWIIDNTEENFQIAWLQCYKKLIAIKYTEKDLLETDPTIKIYSCLSDHDDSTLEWLISWKNMFYRRWTITDKRFIILYKDADTKALAEQILTY